MGQVTTSAQVAAILTSEVEQAMLHPSNIFGYAMYGNGVEWAQLDLMSGGIQEYTFGVLAARPKVGKTQLACAWIPNIAMQADRHGLTLKVITLETTTKAYQRRIGAVMAKIKDPLDIRRGMLTENELIRYTNAQAELAALPIEYLSLTDKKMTFEETMVPGASGVTFNEVADFIRSGGDTFYFVLDHIGLLRDNQDNKDIYTSITSLTNKLTDLCHTTSSGLVITHVNRGSVGGRLTLASLAGSDTLGRNLDVGLLLDRPMMDKTEKLTAEDLLLFEGEEPGWLGFYSRNEGMGVIPVRWLSSSATFEETVLSPELIPQVEIPLKKSKHNAEELPWHQSEAGKATLALAKDYDTRMQEGE